jgi:hypothetical protein
MSPQLISQKKYYDATSWKLVGWLECSSPDYEIKSYYINPMGRSSVILFAYEMNIAIKKSYI